jgi:hypothetical protein
LFPNEQIIKTPTKILEELQKQREEEQADFRYSVGPLPNWAKAKVSTGGKSAGISLMGYGYG